MTACCSGVTSPLVPFTKSSPTRRLWASAERLEPRTTHLKVCLLDKTFKRQAQAITSSYQINASLAAWRRFWQAGQLYNFNLNTRQLANFLLGWQCSCLHKNCHQHALSSERKTFKSWIHSISYQVACIFVQRNEFAQNRTKKFPATHEFPFTYFDVLAQLSAIWGDTRGLFEFHV